MKEDKYIQKQCPSCKEPFWSYLRNRKAAFCSAECKTYFVDMQSALRSRKEENIKLKKDNSSLRKRIAELEKERGGDPMEIRRLKKQIDMRQYTIEKYQQWFADRMYIMPNYRLPIYEPSREN